jgi:hypothetical protein
MVYFLVKGKCSRNLKREEGSISNMLKNIELQDLQTRQEGVISCDNLCPNRFMFI